MELSKQFKVQAAKELREEDLRRSQSLEQFRDWISKQDHFKNPRTDDNFLLRFLRVKKYSNAEAFKMYEHFLVSCEAYSKWFKNFNLDDERSLELLENGVIFPLKERDQDGCRVVFFQPSKFDMKKFNEHDVYRAIVWNALSGLEDPDTQVGGFSFITDFKDVGMEYFSMFSFSAMKSIIRCITGTVPCRLKKAIYINFPPYGVALAEMGKSFVSKKLTDRLSFYSDSTKVSDIVDEKILPKELGGEVSTEEMVEHFKATVKAQKDLFKQIDEQGIDLDRVNDYEVDPVDSFKKLEID